jgi:hypothetical protein
VASTPTQVKLQVLLPLYIYPAWYTTADYVWDDVAAVSSQYAATVSTTIIIDDSNGEISGPPNSDYQHGIADLRANTSIKIIGYVYTHYGNRPIADVISNIDAYNAYRSDWHIDGFFIDETAPGLDQLAYYTQLYDHIKSLDPNYTTILNPGMAINEAYIAAPSAGDVAMIYENSYASWLSYLPDAYLGNYPANRFAMLAYDVSAANMQSCLALAQTRNISYVWVTDTQTNPWSTLPTYLQAEFASISALNSP